MEEKIVELVAKRGDIQIVYSIFYAKAIEKIYNMEVKSELAILDSKVPDCMYKLKGGCGATAIHPFWRQMDLPKKVLEGYTVRAWMGFISFLEILRYMKCVEYILTRRKYYYKYLKR